MAAALATQIRIEPRWSAAVRDAVGDGRELVRLRRQGLSVGQMAGEVGVRGEDVEGLIAMARLDEVGALAPRVTGEMGVADVMALALGIESAIQAGNCWVG